MSKTKSLKIPEHLHCQLVEGARRSGMMVGTFTDRIIFMGLDEFTKKGGVIPKITPIEFPTEIPPSDEQIKKEELFAQGDSMISEGEAAMRRWLSMLGPKDRDMAKFEITEWLRKARKADINRRLGGNV